ncbi:MAG TPA: HAD family hydrolase [Capsulimonadaceae bacterium]|jgi:phosphoglycolate phosphatase
MPFEMLNLPQPVRAVLFDLDGTLIETHIDFAQMRLAVLELAQGAGFDADSLANLDILAIVEHVRLRLTAQSRPDAASAFRSAAFETLQSLEVAGCSTPVAIPGAAEWLHALSDAGIGVGVVTRNCRVVSERLLSAFDVTANVLLTRDDVQLTKPDPGHLWLALEKLGVEPSDSLMVGDHWMDIQAARNAGCAGAIGVLGRHEGTWFAPASPDLIVQDLAVAHRLLGP